MTETVALKGGLTVSVEALRALWRLEDRVRMIVWDGKALRLAPAADVTDDITVMVRAHRDELASLVCYVQEQGWTKPEGHYAGAQPGQQPSGPTPEPGRQRAGRARKAQP